MVFFYVQHDDPFLRQGEVISNLFELKLQIPEKTNIAAIPEPKFDQIVHPYAIVISQDCDLEQNHKARLGMARQDKMLTHVLLCALFTQDELRDRNKIKADLWKRVRQNQDERYHYLVEAPIKDSGDNLPELIADFKTTFSLPREFVYWLISTGQSTRTGTLCSPYLEDFMHRLYNFLGRVATPEWFEEQGIS